MAKNSPKKRFTHFVSLFLHSSEPKCVQSVCGVQGENDTCLVDAVCGALYDFGLTSIVDDIQRNHRMTLTTADTNVVGTFNNLLNKMLNPIGLVIKGVKICTIEKILTSQYNFPVFMLLVSKGGAFGHHVVSIYNNGIYDANSSKVLSLTQESLNWACGDTKNSICVGAVKAYQLLPKECANDPLLAYTNELGYIWPMFKAEKVQVKVGCTKKGVTKMLLRDFYNHMVE